jgi:hypothetical protein
MSIIRLYRVEMNSQVGERLKSPSSAFSETLVSTIEGAQMGLAINYYYY